MAINGHNKSLTQFALQV